MVCVCIRREESGHRHRVTQTEYQMITDAEIEGIQLQAQECKGWRVTTKI